VAAGGNMSNLEEMFVLNSIEPKVTLHTGDALTILKTLPDESIQMCVTSPPYFGLRKYLADDAPGKEYEIGLEQSAEEYVAKLVEVFREVRRVLRPSGVLFLNLGDSYWGSNQTGGTNSLEGSDKRIGRMFSNSQRADESRPPKNRFSKWQSDTEDSIQVSHTSSKQGRHSVYKPKDLIGIPWMVAFALRADGWWLRSDIIWHKPNPMPESVTDRCTKAHEYIFLLSKSAHYYYDNVAVIPEGSNSISQTTHTRNLRDVWTIATKPFPGSHFAVFPIEIPTRCIKAGTSEKGACPKCGAPWARVVSKSRIATRPGNDSKYEEGHYNNKRYLTDTTTTGWQSTCTCNAGDPVPCVVLDPFSGAGTTGVTCVELGRDYIGIDLNAKYNEMAQKRIAEAQLQIRMEF
jgi:DNA modification methylase